MTKLTVVEFSEDYKFPANRIAKQLGIKMVEN